MAEMEKPEPAPGTAAGQLVARLRERFGTKAFDVVEQWDRDVCAVGVMRPGDRARLVTVDGDGHGVYVYGDNPCVLNLTTQYLLDGELPASDVHCEASTMSGLELDDEGEQRRGEVLDRLAAQ